MTRRRTLHQQQSRGQRTTKPAQPTVLRRVEMRQARTTREDVAPDSEAGAEDDEANATEGPGVKATAGVTAAKTTFETPSNNLDQDGDGVPDPQDSCPKAPEDLDDFDDDDGCPDPDNDADGVPDEEDRCPLEAGVRSPETSRNGCPGNDSAGEPKRSEPKTKAQKRACSRSVAPFAS